MAGRALAVAVRLLLVVGGGYAVSAGLVALFAAILLPAAGLPRAEAVVIASMAGFPVYLAVLVWGVRRTVQATMNWLHTWTGVVLGGLLFAVFWMGTLSVFDREIDSWMAPLTRLPAPPSDFSVDSLRPSLARAIAAKAIQWRAVLPTEREPFARVEWRTATGSVVELFDPLTGASLDDPGTWAASGFFYPFHYSLQLHAGEIGIWLVGAAGMGMLVMFVSGVLVHRRIFADFFTLRIGRKPRRLLLDLHNLSGVVVLPFHVAITLSGLILLWPTYMPSGWQAAYADRGTFNADVFGGYTRPKLNRPGGEVASLDAMEAEARRLWNGDPPGRVTLRNPGDAAAIVQLNRLSEDRVTVSADTMYFDAASGALLDRRNDTRPAMTVQRFIAGLHIIQFRNWTLRWIYFVLGLLGCALIATGLLFWVESRRKRHAQLGLNGVRFVEGLATGSVTGIIMATLAVFVANRLLPLRAEFLGHERAALEIWVFYLVWLSSFGHAWLRPRRAWIEQCWALATLATGAVLLNWITTGDHLIRSLSHRPLWRIAGMDIVLLGGAAISAMAALKLRRRDALSRPSARRTEKWGA